MLASFSDTVQHLRQQLASPLPGHDAHFTMAPRYRQDTTVASVRDKRCREAGVLALLYPVEETPYIILTARRAHLKQHAGQVSFPGGRREPGEDLQTTALREAEEEIGVPPTSVDVLGAMTPLFIPPSAFCVYPFLGALSHTPDLAPQDAEVADILHVPLAQLLDPATVQHEDRVLSNRNVNVPFFAIEGHKVWGATAMMLGELVALLRG